MIAPPAAGVERLHQERNIWMATTRQNGRPHLVPVWFVWLDPYLYIAIQPESVKGRNLRQNHNIALALEDGSDVLICEGDVTFIDPPYPDDLLALFDEKYSWKLTTERSYTLLLQVEPRKWLAWK